MGEDCDIDLDYDPPNSQASRLAYQALDLAQAGSLTLEEADELRKKVVVIDAPETARFLGMIDRAVSEQAAPKRRV